MILYSSNRLSLPYARYVIQFLQFVMFFAFALLGMTSTCPLRALVAHDGPAPAARGYFPCPSFSNIRRWRLWGSRSFPRSECFDDVFVEILTNLELHMKAQESLWTSTGHISSGVSAAATSSRLAIQNSSQILAPQTTPSSDQRHKKAGTVLLERPQPLHKFVLADSVTFSASSLLSSSRAAFTPTNAGPSLSTDSFDHIRGTSRRSPIASCSRLVSSSAYTDDPRNLRPSDARSSCAFPRLRENQDSKKNRTDSRTRLSPWTGRKPLDVSPVRFRFPGTGSYATLNVLVPKPNLVKATGSNGFSSTVFNIAPSGTGVNSAQRNHLAFMNDSGSEGWVPERIKPYRLPVGLSLSDFNASTFNQTSNYLGVHSGGQNATNCSGLATSTAHVVYEVITSTIMINETITLGYNATTPLPVFVTPPPACQIITATCAGVFCPPRGVQGGPNPKEPLHPLKLTPYKSSTSTSTLLVTKKSPAIVRQLSPVGDLFGPTTPAIASQPNSDRQQAAGQNSESSNSQSTSPSSQNADSQKPAAGPSGSQSTGVDDQTASSGNEPNAATHNNGDASSKGGISKSGSTNTGGTSSSSGQVPDDGDASHGEGESSSSHRSISGGGTSSNEAASSDGKASSNEVGPKPEAGSNADLRGTQYFPSRVMAGNLPISIVSNAVIVGTHTVKAGSSPTTVYAKGQTIAIQPSQIVVQGKTIPIKAVFTPPPATSATIGDIPVALRPQDVAIGSETFTHGSSPTSVIYNGQTYSWDASHLVGPGATVAFPSTDAFVPRVTAGGQVFSVYPSQLKALGTKITLPNIATASPFVYKGQTFSVNPSQLVAPGTSITLPPAKRVTPFVYIDHTLSVDASQFMARSTTIPLSSGSGVVTYNGQVLTIKPSKIIGPSTTVALSPHDDSGAPPTAVTTGGLTFSIGAAAAVVGSSTYSFVPGKAPVTIITHGEAVLVGSNGVQFKNVHVPIPTMTHSFSTIAQGDLAFLIAPSEVVVDDHTHTIRSDMTPITTVVDGHTMSIGPKGVGLASTTIPLPVPKPSFSITTRGDITFSIAPSEVVVKGKTYSIASNQEPITTAINGQVMTIGPKGIHIEGTTVDLPALQTTTSVTAAGLTFLVGVTDAVISGTTYPIGSGALLQTVVVGSQTVGIGSAGIVLPSTTIAPEQTPVAVTVGGLTLSIDSSQAVIDGTTYSIGSGAVDETIMKGSTTIRVGVDGVALSSTTIRPWSNAAQTGSSSVLGTFGASSAAIASRTLTPIVTGKVGDKEHVAGTSARMSPSSTLMGLLLGTVLLGLSLN